MSVHIIDGHALLAVSDVVRPDRIGDVFSALSGAVATGSLLVTRTVIEVIRRRDPDSACRVWVDTIIGLNYHVKVDYGWQIDAQAKAQSEGYEDGLEDIASDRPTGIVEIVGLVLHELNARREPIVVTEDRAEKPLRPSLEPFCKKLGWPTLGLANYLDGQALGDCLFCST